MSFNGQRRIGAFKPPRTGPASVEDAETLAAAVFAALVEEPARLQRFMQETGVGPDDLRAAAGSTGQLAAILEHVLADESLLLVIASHLGRKPEALAQALASLQPPPLGSP